MRFLLCVLLIAQSLQAQASSFIPGPLYNYSNQFTGINGWPNNGRHSSGDSTRGTWSLDGNTYVGQDDGFGPNYACTFGVGANMFLATVTPFTTPAAGSLQSLVNCMPAWGHSSQDIWSNSSTIKASGLLANKDSVTGIESLYWSNYQQSSNNEQTGSCVNILRSDTHGVSWLNTEHVNHSTGTPTQAADVNGDVTSSASVCMFPADIKSVIYQQYCRGNFACSVVDNNNNWIYCLAESQLGQHMYACRVAPADIKKLDGALYQFYAGPVPSNSTACNDNSNWTFTEPSHVAVEPSFVANVVDIIGPTIYIPPVHSYMTVVGTLTGKNFLLQAPSICGAYSQLFDFGAVQEGWHAPMLASLSTAGAATFVDYMVTSGPPENTAQPQFNTYGVMFHATQFIGAVASIQVTGSVRTTGKVSGL